MLASRFVQLLAVLLLALCGAGCQCDSEPPPEATLGASPAELSALEHYVRGYNLTLQEPHAALKKYLEQIPKQGPTPGLEIELPNFPLAGEQLAQASQQYATASSNAPASLSQLQPLTQRCLEILQTLHTSYESARQYYSSKEFTEDQYARGQELHQVLMQQYSDYATCRSELEQQLDAHEGRLAEAELQRYVDPTTGKPKTSGLRAESYLFRKFLMAAKQLARADASEFEKHLSEVQDAHLEIAAFTAIGKPSPEFSSFQELADAFYEQGKEVASARSRSDSQHAQHAQAQLVEGYNQLVFKANQLRAAGR